jgi:CBS domain-containing protein
MGIDAAILPQGRREPPDELRATVRTLLKQKSGEIWTIAPEACVYDAIKLMAEKRIGSVLVMDAGRLVGILSERDYARKVVLQDKSSKTTAVQEIMTAPVVSVSMDNTVGECMRIITEKRIRHLPVIEEDAVAGIVSIGDLVNWVINEQQQTIRHLEAYITGVAA